MSIGYANVELEEFEFGDDLLFVNVTVKCQVWPGEPAVPRYSDGSGYPGSPPEAEILGIFIDECYDGDKDIEISEALKIAVEYYIYDNEDLWYEQALESAAESYYDRYDN